MAIDRLPPTSALLAALRGDLARKAAREDGHARASGMAQAQQSSGARVRDPNKLRRELAEIVKDVQADDPASVDEARPRIVRAVLLWEFGPDLREHPDWQPMIQRLVTTLQSDGRHRDDFSELVRMLKT